MAGESAFGVPVLFEPHVIECFKARSIASESINALAALTTVDLLANPDINLGFSEPGPKGGVRATL